MGSRGFRDCAAASDKVLSASEKNRKVPSTSWLPDPSIVFHYRTAKCYPRRVCGGRPSRLGRFVFPQQKIVHPHILARFFKKGFRYCQHTRQPFSPNGDRRRQNRFFPI